MDVRPLVLAFLLLALACGPARAHDGDHPTHGDTIQDVNFDFAGAVEEGGGDFAARYGDAGLTYLPLRWCGTQRATDDTANQAYAASLPQVKFVYAYAAGEANRSAEWADVLQANASLISRFYAQQSDGQRAPRFDLGTSCGPDHLDIATVQLPQARSAYVDKLGAVEAAVNELLPRSLAQPRVYVILADKLSSRPTGSLWGQGTYWPDAAKGTGNPNNAGGATSVMWIPQGQAPPAEAAKDHGFWPEGFLHEMNHNFGAVQNDAPNSTTAGHCRDGRDVMCYADGGLSYDPNVCASIATFATGFVQMLDCNRDDYFSPAPAASSWLATHFNTFDNVFVADCPALGNQCGGGVAPAVTGGPSVSGATSAGNTLTATLGTWSGSPSLSWQWEEESGGNWLPYAHDSLTLTLGTVHVGRRYRLKVTAAGAETVVARSVPTREITAKITPRNDVRPSIAGLPHKGATLTGSRGSWTDAVTYEYQWYRQVSGTTNVTPISGATASTYVVTGADLGFQVRLLVYATSIDGVGAYAWSNATGVVIDPPVNDSPPTVSGTAKVGRTLTSSDGGWTSSSAATYARQWQREVGGTWSAIAAATGTTYLLTAADAGLRVRLLVTATNADGATSAASAPTAAVATPAPPVNTAPPVATGTAQQGQTLTVEGDTWTGAASTAVRWERRPAGGTWTPIAAQTARTYLLGPDDVDADVRAVVTASNEDGDTPVTTAARGPVVTNVAPEATAMPQVTGVARTGQMLTATTGTWLRANSYAYAWERQNGGTWSPIPSATASTYTPAAADAGLRLRVVVTATGWGGSTSAASVETEPVADPPVLVSAPTIGGVVQRGRTLTATSGTWTGATSYAYAWERQDGAAWSAIADATQATYVPSSADVGHALRVRVTATGAHGTADTASDPTAAVAAGAAPVNDQPPVVTGTLYAGETLTAQGDDWTGETGTAVAWQRRVGDGAWSAIAGATGRTYTLAAADVGAFVRAVVTASNADGDTPVASAPRGPVDGDPANETPPAVTGTARTGQTLTASPGTWLRASSFTYAWQRRTGETWTAIAGATAGTYVPVKADAGLPLRVVVTATGSRASASAASEPTGPVAHPPAMTAPPEITGTPKRGATLTAAPGEWTDATAFAYRWERQGTTGWSEIAGAGTSTYVPAAADVGHALRVRVTASSPTGQASATSAPTAPVADLQPPVAVAPPQVTGPLYVGETLTVAGDDFAGEDAVAVAWERRTGDGAWTAIAGAAARTYTLAAADLDAHVRAVLTATNADGQTTRASEPRGPVDADPVNTVAPSIQGTPRLEQPLIASPGTWLHASAFLYAWQRLSGGVWTDIPGATSHTFTPMTADGGAPLRVLVTGRGSRRDVTAASAKTAPVTVPDTPPVDPPAPPAPPAPSVVAPPATTPTATSFAVALRAGRRAAGKLTVTVTGTDATLKGARLKLRDGAYTARLCAGRRCLTRRLKVRRGRIAATRVTLPAATGRVDLTLKPRRGATAKGRLVLP